MSAGNADMQESLKSAIDHHRRGELATAETLYAQAIASAPEDSYALRCLASLLSQQKRFDEALACFDRVLSIQPADAPVWNEHGAIWAASGRFDPALVSFQRAAALDSNLAEPACNAGQALVFLGRHSEALAWLDRAIALRPTLLLAHALKVDALQMNDRHSEALEACQRALELGPETANLQNALGKSLAALGRHAEALAAFDRALSREPRHIDALNNRGNVLAASGRPEEALVSFDRALALNPDFAAALSNRGIILVRLGRHVQALESLNRGLALRPDDAAALNSRGNALAALGRKQEALASFEEALAKQPDFIEALLNYSSWLGRVGRADEAARAMQRVVEIDPDYPEAAGGAFDAFARCCDWANYEARASAIVEGFRAGTLFVAPFHMLLISDSPSDHLECARVWVRERSPAANTLPAPVTLKGRERLRIAYLSPDFRDHPVAYQAAALFERHDRTRFETIAVAYGRPASSDPLRARLERGFDRFITVPDAVSDRAVVQQLRDLEVAIAVDLAGYTTHARPGVLALRPAPIQVNFLGYPGTLGADYIDYIIADSIVIPSDHRRFYGEHVVHLPNSFFVTDDRRAVGTPPSRREAGLPESGFVFCCFNRDTKITPALFDVWMRILKQVPGSILWLGKPAPVAVDNLRREAGRLGIAPERLVFATRVADPAQYLARLQLADLFLDTLPYNAHTIACDALWAGLPVVTCLGAAFPGRVAASLLHAVGLPELAVDSLSRYETLACELACDDGRLTALRERLCGEGHRSALFDTNRFRRDLEWAYRKMWELYSRGQMPIDFAVPSG